MTHQIEYIETTALIPYARNSRTHSEQQVAQVAQSIRQFGFTNPVLIDANGVIVAGHGRVMAAKSIGINSVPCIRLGHLNEAQIRAYVIADNKLAENAGWDEDMLRLEIQHLQSVDFDLSLMGFSDDDLASLLEDEEPQQEGLTDADQVPEAQRVVISRPGDIWTLGKHRLMCGDSTSVEHVAALMNGAEADMIFTDPPYGMSYDGGRGKQKFGMIANDDAQGADLIGLVRDALTMAKMSSKDGAAAYICFPWRTYSEFEAAVEAAGFEVNACIVWDKQHFGLGHQDYRPQHEFIFYSKGGVWHGDRAQSDVWYCKREHHGSYVHPTQKPVDLIERALSNSSKRGDLVIDCFGGSGSTLIACEKTGRNSRLLELDPKYCDVIIRRWQEFTGKAAVREADGATFDSLCHEEVPA